MKQNEANVKKKQNKKSNTKCIDIYNEKRRESASSKNVSHAKMNKKKKNDNDSSINVGSNEKGVSN